MFTWQVGPGSHVKGHDVIACDILLGSFLLSATLLHQNGESWYVIGVVFSSVVKLKWSTVAEIPTVIRLLTQSPPSVQETVLGRFFTNNVSFVHPFCRVPSFQGSRWWVAKIFQWYKIMSPRIELEVHSIGMSIRDGDRRIKNLTSL
jgi:hypothetical protein